MIIGNIHTYKSCGLCDLTPYIELLKSIPKDAPNGRTMLENGAFYTVYTVNLANPEEKNFEAHKKFVDIQYILDGEEQMEYADLRLTEEAVPYREDKDVFFVKGKGDLLTFREGDFVIFCPADAHKPGLGVGVSRKVVVKVPIPEKN